MRAPTFSPCRMQRSVTLSRCTVWCAPQVRHIRRLLADAFGEERAAALEVGSVDGFQGREKEVIVFSCVRASAQGTCIYVHVYAHEYVYAHAFSCVCA